jgi:uncharacterized protein YdeI (YjbR/CyaY-like superfamily)
MEIGEVRHFEDQASWRAWLEAHHEAEDEVWVGFRRKASGLPSITWPQAVDEALCFGWIDGIRKGVDGTSYTIRFTPRRARSVWSDVNTRRARELIELGLMRPAGLRALEARDAARAGVYSFEQRTAAALAPEHEARLRANAAAWADWTARPPWYRRAATWWVVSAKREATRERRLATLLAHSERGEPVPPLSRPS